MPARITNRQGVGIWGVLGFVGALRKILLQTTPTHVAVLFDGEHENQRQAVNQDYKSNRVDYRSVPDAENPFSQLPLIYQALEHLKIPYAETTACEVDDWIAGYVKRYGDCNKIVISSFDSDFFQLVGPTVSVLRYRGQQSVLCDTVYITQRFGVLPCQYADYKSLVGDKADNISGAEKIGGKTAARLLQTYGSLENILENCEAIPQKAIRETLIQNRRRLLDNYHIIRLAGWDVLPFSLGEISFGDCRFSTSQVLQNIGLLP